MAKNNQSRRNFMKTTAAAGAATGLGGLGSAQLAARQDDQEVAKTFRLLGQNNGWIAAGDNLSGTNPDLNLEAGKKYRIIWRNVDGKSHNIAIFGTDKNLLVHSPLMANEGETQTVEFIATEAMVDYYCEVHYIAMRGDIRVSGTADSPYEKSDQQYFEQGPEVGLDTVATGFNWPTAMGIAAGKKFVADQTGEVWQLTENGRADEPLIDVSDQLFHEKPLHPETGMLGLALHPDFQNNRKFYTRESRPVKDFSKDLFPAPREKYHHMMVVTEYKANQDLTSAEPTEDKFVLKIPSPGSNHNSGDLDFGPNGLLYVAVGDGGFGGDTGDMFGHVPGGNGQDVENNLLGSILRIDVDTSETVRGDQKPYAIPEDNPLVGKPGLDEQFAWGFRNPWGMSVDSQGRVFAGDVGRSLQEEVNLVVSGGNYGWRIREGTLCFDPFNQGNPPKRCASHSFEGESLFDPIAAYPHNVPLEDDPKSGQTIPIGQSVVGGHIYEGDTLSQLQGKYVFGDWGYSPVVGSGRLLVATGPEMQKPPTAKQTSRNADAAPWNIKELQVPEMTGALDFFVSSFANSDDNELFVLTSASFQRDANDGAVHKIVPPGQHNLSQRAVVSGEQVPRQEAGPGTANETQTTAGTTTPKEATTIETETTTVTNETTENETTEEQ